MDDLANKLGFFSINFSIQILKEMRNFSFAILFLGLIFDIIVFLFVFISVLLIYSLLMISVETKTFEIGVMRMIGVGKSGLILMVLVQSVFFVIPAIIFGYGLSILAISRVYKLLFNKAHTNYSPLPDPSATVQGLVIGIAIPLLASIIPI